MDRAWSTLVLMFEPIVLFAHICLIRRASFILTIDLGDLDAIQQLSRILGGSAHALRGRFLHNQSTNIDCVNSMDHSWESFFFFFSLKVLIACVVFMVSRDHSSAQCA